jgi:hypothetical protein
MRKRRKRRQPSRGGLSAICLRRSDRTVVDGDMATNYHRLLMSEGAQSKPSRAGAWTAQEVARERAAAAARMARANERGPEANLKEAAALARFANRVAAAAAAARRHDS